MVLISLIVSLFPVAVTGQQPSGPTGWTQITTITIKDFDNYKFNEGKTQRNELNYINTFNIWKVGSCYVTCYITGGVLYHIFLLYNTLYAPVM
jgi:hypothetical protein